MQTLLIAGIDTLLGSNLALALGDEFKVVGLSAEPFRLDGVNSQACPLEKADDVAAAVRSTRPDWIVYCGPLSRSSWEPADTFGPGAQQAAVNLACEAGALGCVLTVISTDEVFSGPWLFHTEDEAPQGQGWRATAALAMEASVRERCPQSLVVRTHAYGWAPCLGGTGLIERIHTALESGSPLELEADRGATPILAADLADVLAAAFRKNLTGLYHVGGSERTSPYHLGLVLAERLSVSPDVLKPVPHEVVDGAVCETSLRTGRIRSALGIAMPMLRDGLVRLCHQRTNGVAERIHGARTPTAICESVA